MVGWFAEKNVINTLMSVLFCCGLATVMWFAVGYSISFGEDVGGLGVVGNLSNAFFSGVSATEAGPYAANIPARCLPFFN